MVTDTNTSSGYSAEITIDNTELLVGMSAKAKIVIKDRGTQLAVPYDLIRQDDNGDSYVLVAEANEGWNSNRSPEKYQSR
mgnify:CR=1 FL=1